MLSKVGYCDFSCRFFFFIVVLLTIQDIQARRHTSKQKLRRVEGRTQNSTWALWPGNCTSVEFSCTNGRCIKGDQVCDGIDSCGDSSDETTFCKSKYRDCWPWQTTCINGYCDAESYQCNNGKCIGFTVVCDRIDNCGDGSDELRAVVGFKCPLGGGGDICVLPQRYVKDDVTQCNNDADESETTDKTLRTFHCFDGSMVISDSQQCDDIVDCPNLSDECPCEERNKKLCEKLCTQREELGQSNCTLGCFVCEDGKELVPRQVCDAHIDCQSGIDEMYCDRNSSHEIIRCAGDVYGKTKKLARACDGRPECFDLSDECIPRCQGNSSKLPDFCNLNISSAPFNYECSTNESSMNLTIQEICNGIWSECNPRIPEEESDCPGRFYCASGALISIDIALKCNGFAECDDGSDETDCRASRFDCQDDDAKPLSVPWSFIMDGVQDCGNGRDECPTDMGNRPIESREYLIASPFSQVWVWISGFSCIFGNLYIIVNKVRKFSKIRKARGLAKCNHFFVFNLAVADSIMGIYLLGIAVKHSLVAGSYCRYDVAWRTGPACFMLGAATVISSEASVFMLVLLTTLRLISVHYPLKTRHIKFKWAAFSVIVAWTIALTLGFLPVSPLMKWVFTNGAFIPSKLIAQPKARLSRVRNFAFLLSRFSPNSSEVDHDGDWPYIAQFLNENHRDHSIKGFYGYYSEYSVCMPNFYVTTNEPMWEYSCAIIMVNFLIFLYILAAYIAIYRKATKKKIQSTADRTSNMQRKVIRVIVSDFLCWMPICIISILTVSRAIVTHGRIYGLTAIVILPINNVLNPFLYSNLIDIIWKTRKQFFSRMFTSLHTSPNTKSASHNIAHLPMEEVK